MAEIPSDIGVPTVAPDTTAPDTRLQVDNKIGPALQQAGGAAVDLSKTLGQVHSQGVLNDAIDQAGQLRSQYMQLGGQQAVDALPQFQQQINQIFAKGESQMGSLDELADYQSQSRRYANLFAGDITTYGTEQMKAVRTATHQATQQQGLDLIASNPLDNQTVTLGAGQVMTGTIRRLQDDGNWDNLDIRTAAIDQAKQAITLARIAAVAPKNPTMAMQIADQNQGILGTKYADVADGLQRQLRSGQAEQATDSIADAAFDIRGTASGNQPAGSGQPAAVQPPVNNPGNLKVPGNPSAFQQFPTPQAGMQALQDQLLKDNLPAAEGGHGLTTVAQIIGGGSNWPGYAPASENDTQSYIGNVAAALGVKPDQPIDLRDPAVMQKMTAAVVKQEGSGATSSAAGAMAAGTSAAGQALDTYGANIAQIADGAAAKAEVQYPDIPGIGDVARQKVLSRYSLLRQEQADAQSANFDIVSNYVNQHQITDPAQVENGDPGVKQAWLNLTPDQQASALTMMNKNLSGNRTVDSPAAQQAVNYYSGLAVTDPKTFLATDFQSSAMLDLLTTEQRQTLMAQQNDLLKGIYKGPSYKDITDATEVAKPILASAGVYPADSQVWQTGQISNAQKARNQQLYTQAVGQLARDITAFQQQNDRLPTPDEVQKLTQRLILQGTVNGKSERLFQAEGGGKLDPNFMPEIPTSDLTGINRSFYQNYGRYPTQQEAGMIYLSAQASQGNVQGFLAPSDADVASNLPGGLNLSGLPPAGSAPLTVPAPVQRRPYGRFGNALNGGNQ